VGSDLIQYCAQAEATRAAIFTEELDTSKESMRRTPLSPRCNPDQKASRPIPIGVTHPMPVITTRRGRSKPLNIVVRFLVFVTDNIECELYFVANPH